MSEIKRTPKSGKGERDLSQERVSFEPDEKEETTVGISGFYVDEDSDLEESPIFDMISEDELQAWEDYLAHDFASGLSSAILNIANEDDLEGSYAMTREPRKLTYMEITALNNDNLGQEPNKIYKMDGLSKEARKVMDEERDIGDEETLDARPPEGFDGGMGAGFAVSDEELEAILGQPAFEVPIPIETSKRGMPGYDESTNQAFDSPDNMEKIGNQRSLPRLGVSEKLLELIITDERIDSLWKRADRLQEEISEKVDDHAVASYLLEMVRSAKTQILNDRSNYGEAERALNEVAYRINFAKRLNQWTKRDARFLLIYLVFFGLLIAAGLFLLPPILRNLVINGPSTLSISFPSYVKPDDIFNLISAMMWGGLGGVVGAVFSLYKHVAWDQDFNPQHNMWYYTQPIMGIPIGAFIYLFIQIGFDVTAGATDIEIGSPYFIYILAFVAGFQQNVVYSIVREILRVFKIEVRNGSKEGKQERKRVSPEQFADFQAPDG